MAGLWEAYVVAPVDGRAPGTAYTTATGLRVGLANSKGHFSFGPHGIRGKGVETYRAWARARGALDLAQVFNAILDAQTICKAAAEGIAGVVRRVVHSRRVTGAVGGSGPTGGRRIDGFVNALVDNGETLGVHDREVIGHILDGANNGVVATGADGDNPLEVNDGVVGQGVVKGVAGSSLEK